jgi:diaminopimelate decarboxylase/aspartate kinase
MPDRTRWWEERKQDLISVARESGPICVVNEEALNEIVFDLLSLETVDELLFPVSLRAHPRMLDALGRVGAGFLCDSAKDVAALGVSLPGRYASRVLLVGKESMAASCESSDLDRVVLAVFDPGVVSSLPECFQGRVTLLGIPAHQAQSGKGAGTGPLIEALAEAGASVRGVYLPWGGRVPEKAAQEALKRWRESLGREGILALGQGAGAAFDEDKARLDSEQTAENVAELRDLVDARAVWLDPGERIFSEIGVLLVPVEKVFRSGERICVQMPEGTGRAISGALRGDGMAAWNLTGDEGGEVTHVALCEPEEGGDATAWPVVVPAMPKPGDVLALPLHGFPGATREEGPSGLTEGSVCYLNARRICQVPL